MKTLILEIVVVVVVIIVVKEKLPQLSFSRTSQKTASIAWCPVGLSASANNYKIIWSPDFIQTRVARAPYYSYNHCYYNFYYYYYYYYYYHHNHYHFY
jgi:hypothetical protein